MGLRLGLQMAGFLPSQSRFWLRLHWCDADHRDAKHLATIFIATACSAAGARLSRIDREVRDWQSLAAVFLDMALIAKLD